jgi:hypothetical protein
MDNQKQHGLYTRPISSTMHRTPTYSAEEHGNLIKYKTMLINLDTIKEAAKIDTDCEHVGSSSDSEAPVVSQLSMYSITDSI